MFKLSYPVILASSSKARQTLLTKLHIAFESHAPNVDETPLDNESPYDLVTRLAKLKATALTTDHPKHLIIASDQVCVIDGKITGKPHTRENAIKQLRAASGKKVTFYTSIALYYPGTGLINVEVDTFNVYFRKLSLLEIETYITLDDPLMCAGSFKCEGLGITLFEKLEGDDPNSLIGLPLIRLSRLLREIST